MADPKDSKLTEQQVEDLADLISWLRRCPSRHRHLLFLLDAPAYCELLGIEESCKDLIDKVGALLTKHS